MTQKQLHQAIDRCWAKADPPHVRRGGRIDWSRCGRGDVAAALLLWSRLRARVEGGC